MAKVKLRKDLNAQVARKLVPEHVKNVAEELGRRVAANAPGLKTWTTSGDERTRKTHWEAHMQQVPENVRYVLTTPPYDRRHYDRKPKQYPRFPRDREALTYGNFMNCRCMSVLDPHGISKTKDVSEPLVRGNMVVSRVTFRAPRIGEAENGNSMDKGTYFALRALQSMRGYYGA